MGWSSRSKRWAAPAPVNYTVGQQILISMAEIEALIVRYADDVETFYPDIRRNYQELMRRFWALDTADYTIAMDWAYKGGLKLAGHRPIHLRSSFQETDMPHTQPPTKRLMPTKDERQMMEEKRMLVVVTAKLMASIGESL